ncbi:TetR/AcrR family transcriptional regulator C-terminal domain-containing protein [Streptomyces sp. NPDC002935]|uniref:TetR/AcrR family transcriptional regulator C-terminal domain-containing protein n=1 Tax=Streptomyces sp. NPDC002935 TaxID=3154545 RepID=UPI0033A74A47
MTRSTETAKQFPHLRERLDTAEYAAAPDNSFDFGLQVLLDGFEARLAADRTESAR